MKIQLNNIKPTYMSEDEISSSDVYLTDNVTFENGNKYLIQANSGHGKSSVLNFIYGKNINFNGTIKYLENNNEEDIFKLRISKISYVFQDLKLFPSLTIFENIELKNNITNHKTTEEIYALIKLVNLEHKKDSVVQNLSLGQRQRVAVIRAICQPFEFLLLDEPFSHLDEENISILSGIINTELEKQNASLIMTALGKNSYFNFDKILNL